MSEAVIYLVTSGDYSDYCVSAAFSTHELAEAWITIDLARAERREDTESGEIVPYNDSEYSVREMPLDPDPSLVPTPVHGAWVAKTWQIPYMALYLDITWVDGERVRPGEITRAASKFPQYRRIEVKGYGNTPEYALRAMRELERAIKAGTIVVPDDD